MDEFLRVLRTFAEFPLTVESTPTTNAYHHWQWRFRGRPMASDWTYSAYLSRFRGDVVMPWSPHARHCDVVGYHRRLSRRLIVTVERVFDG